MTDLLIETAPAKINLFLHVGARRDDGFHPLQSLAVFTGMGDRLTLEQGDAVRLAVKGPFAPQLSADDNLVLAAARALQADFAPRMTGAALTLTKNLPVASGIGGGSSDAAAALRGLALLWSLPPGAARLAAIAAKLGSDVPVCLNAVPAFMEGRGEILTPVKRMPRLAVLLVNPGDRMPTRDVFGALESRRGTGLALPADGFDDTADLLRFLESTTNDLEAPARAIAPSIAAVLEDLKAQPGALLARMSGSGATCFGLFADDDCCARAADILRTAHSGWWIAPTFVPEYGLVHEDQGRDFGPSPEGL